MRNFYLLFISILSFTFLNAQFTESFENGIPATWTIINGQSSNTWISGTPTDAFGSPVAAQDGNLVAKINFNFTNGHNDYLISPAITVTSGVNGYISFWARSANATSPDLFDVKLSTTGTAEADFTINLAENIIPPTNWTNYQYNLNGYEGQTVYIAIRAGSQANNQELDIDLFESFPGPNCPDISNISATENTGDTVTLTWDNGNTETQWDIEYGVAGFTPTGAPTEVATTNPYTISGLSSNITYDFYIRANCGGTDISQWVGPFTITTIINYCAGAPFTDSGGPTGNYQNGENLSWLISPTNAGDRVRVTFTEFNTENNFDKLKVYDGPDNTYPALHPGDGFMGVMGTNATVPGTLTATSTSGSLFFVFTSDGSINRTGWIANVVCEAQPTCPDISGLTANNVTGESAELSWTPGAGQTSWSIEYGPAGFTPGTGTIVSGITATPYTLTGLNPITNYEFYVQGECPNSDFSVWAGPKAFTTGCATFVPTYIQDFETAWLPPCWIEYSNGNPTTGPNTPNQGDWINDGFANVGNAGAAKINLYNLGTSDWLVSPNINLGDGTIPYQLKYDVATTQWASTNPLGFGADDRVQVLIFHNNTWTPLMTYDSTNTPLNTTEIISLVGYTGIVQIGFWGDEGTIDDPTDIDFFIDNFVVRPVPACPEVTALSVTTFNSNSVTLGWTPTGPETSWVVEYGPTGFILGTGTTVTANSNPFTVTGLTSNTAYTFYVYAVCLNGEYSAATGPVNTATSPDFCAGDLFTDSGGAVVNYGNGQDINYLIAPANPGDRVVVTFTNFSTEEGFDKLYVYEGTDASGTPLHTLAGFPDGFSGTNMPPVFSSEDPSGALFFVWHSDASVNEAGWIANVVCEALPSCLRPYNVTFIDSTPYTATFSWDSSATEFEIVYVPSGGDPAVDGTTVTPNPTSSPYTITGLNHSTAYDFYIRAICPPGETSNWSYAVPFRTKVPNDECDIAIELISSPIGMSCSTSENGSVAGATDSGIPGCLGTADDDVWYTFTAISNRHKITVSNVNGSATDLTIEVFEGADCANLTSVVCSDPLIVDLEEGVLDVVVGETYYVRVYTSSPDPEDTSFTICLTALAPFAENDTCVDAIVVGDTTNPIPYTNNQSNYAVAGGGFVTGCAGGTNDGVWYEIIGNGGDIIVEVTPMNGYNTELGVYSTPCGDPNPVAVGCSSIAGTNGMESVTFASELGVSYWVNIGAISGSFDFPEGDFDIHIYTETTGVDDIINSDFSDILYPNPTKNVVHYVGDKEIKTVAAYDLSGTLINARINLNENSMDLSHFSTGVYILLLRFNDESVSTYKIIKQ